MLCLHQEHLLLSREYLHRQGHALSSSAVTTVLRVHGTLPASAVERAMEMLITRHPALRLVVEPDPTVSPERRLEDLIQFGRTGVFQPGLYRARVGDVPAQTEFRVEQIAEQEHLLHLTVDHLVADAVSMKILRKELAALLAGGTLGPLPPVDYAGRQRVAIESGTFAAGIAYWKEQWNRFSDGRIGFDDLPFSLPRPPQPRLSFGVVNRKFDPPLTNAIRAHARKSRVTLFVWFLAAFTRVLQEHTGKQRLGLWCHFSNRMLEDTRNAVGWFAHTHLLGIDFAAENRMLHCREVVARAAEHQEVPAMLVWRELGGYPRHPDAKVLLDVSSADDPLPSGNGLRIEHVPELSPVVGRFASLGLYVRDQRDTLVISLQYLEDRFARPAMEQFLSDFQSKVMQTLA